MVAKNVKVNLIERGGWFHAVVSYYDQGKRKQKSVALGLKTKGNKRRAEEKCKELLAEWEKKQRTTVHRFSKGVAGAPQAQHCVNVIC